MLIFPPVFGNGEKTQKTKNRLGGGGCRAGEQITAMKSQHNLKQVQHSQDHLCFLVDIEHFYISGTHFLASL